jgi:pimeloyl-ACP methyl ester carboxylesterase
MQSSCVAVLMVVVLFMQGCMFHKLDEQLQQIDQLCVISGTIAGDPDNRDPRIVVLLQPAPAGAIPAWRLADHFVAEGDGRWVMVAQPGEYALGAFEDRSHDLVYQPGEPVLNVADDSRIHCATGSRIENRALQIPANGGRAYFSEVDIAALQTRTPDQQLGASLRSLAAAGTVTTLADPRFSAENVKAGMWAPYDFLLNAGPGVYFLEPYDPTRIPVLFVHGISGSPLNFTYLIEHLDRKRFQPWVYYYPSGARLGNVADHLAQTMLGIDVRHRVPQLVVVAHSMGGLVSRGFLLRRSDDGTKVPLFITLSTPWGGHDAAQMGVEYAPTVVRSWYDMAPGSEYLQSLFYSAPDARRTLPTALQHHLLFSFRKTGVGDSSDGVVSVASQLRSEAQDDAVDVRGFDDTHTGILEDPAAVALVNKFLSGVR